MHRSVHVECACPRGSAILGDGHRSRLHEDDGLRRKLPDTSPSCRIWKVRHRQEVRPARRAETTLGGPEYPGGDRHWHSLSCSLLVMARTVRVDPAPHGDRYRDGAQLVFLEVLANPATRQEHQHAPLASEISRQTDDGRWDLHVHRPDLCSSFGAGVHHTAGDMDGERSLATIDMPVQMGARSGSSGTCPRRCGEARVPP